jgi:hypothetical protein
MKVERLLTDVDTGIKETEELDWEEKLARA